MNPTKPVFPGTPTFGECVALLWIVGTFLYFYVNFSLVFFRANQPAIENLLQKLGFPS